MDCNNSLSEENEEAASEESFRRIKVAKATSIGIIKKKRKRKAFMIFFSKKKKKTEALASCFSFIFVWQYSLLGVCLMFQTRGPICLCLMFYNKTKYS